MIQEANWNNFKTKFGDVTHTAFERLCYLLFCKEFNKDIGIFRFKNHAGIETNPVERDGQVIGWQAKFYETRLSDTKNQKDITDSIDTTKERHPAVNRIIFYTNQEFGQDAKKTDPKYKTVLENHAKSKGIEIEWRTASYFESPFVCEQNFSISEHFFSLKKGILDSIGELVTSTESVLKPVHSEIFFNTSAIKLDRLAIIGSIKDTMHALPLVILSGGAGVGKTAVIKDLYETIKESAPLFVFKATQFKDLSHINQLFNNYGEITFLDFINEHKDIAEKYVVFDSAERLSEIEDQDIFRIFLSELLENDWKVIFTVRHSYLDDLRFQLKEFYGANFTSLNIPDLRTEEVERISKERGFVLPKNERFLNILLTPLYLREYLQNYSDISQDTSYADFRDIIWRKQIQNSTYQLHNLHRRREDCFLKIAHQRANEGGNFVKTDGLDQEALQKLEADEIVKYDSSAGGYFITHDIYEEWALDKIIERSFIGVQDYQNFYQNIGSSLPVRRAFRGWLSDKLFTNDEGAKKLIEFTVQSTLVDRRWKDEALVSVLLSDYSQAFFERFEEDLLKDPEKTVSYDGTSKIVKTLSIDYKFEAMLLYRVVFLLRIACKTINEDFFNRLGLTRTESIPLKTIFITPKGSGWSSAISFINKHREKLQLKYMNVILPMLDEWNQSHKEGESTKEASQIALFYYNTLTAREGFYFSSHDDTKDKLIRTILNGSDELKSELTQIIDQVVVAKDTSHRSRYYELVNTALSSIIHSSEIAKHLPKELMKLANLFWFNASIEDTHSYPRYRNDIEQYFDLNESHHDYYPASAFQTPIFTLLQVAPKETVDFILSFTNRSIEYFSKSELGNEAQKIEVVVGESGNIVKQYIGHRIWNIYRGTQVASPLLESVHMALEKWLLMIAKTMASETLEQWCLYLIKNSRSASISAVVTSVVLAEPSKLFNVAKILLRTKDFIFFDSARTHIDMSARGNYSISHDPLGIFKNERLQTCEDKHRAFSLENQILSYQVFSDSEKEVTKNRQEILWKTFDEYYAKLPDRSKETENDKTWRLCLARMDRRKMKMSTEKKDNQVLISFHPEIDPELKKYSEDALAKNTESMKYLPLQLWARSKFEKSEDVKKYPQYQDHHDLVLLETKEIVEKLNDDKSEDGNFTLFYRSVPSFACAVLIRDYFDRLKPEEVAFCKDVILDYSSRPLRKGFRYQAGDGLDAAVKSLPFLIKRFPAESGKIKETLMLVLFDSYPIGMSQRVSDYAVSAVLQHLWQENPHDANAIFHGYLLLKPRFDLISDSVRAENRKKNRYDFSRTVVIERFRKKYASEIRKAVSNQCVYEDITDLAKIDSDTLVTAFLLLPLRSAEENHKKFLRGITPVLVSAFRNDDKQERLDYVLEQKFLEKFAYFVLTSNKADIESYVQPFVDLIGDFRRGRNVADVLNDFIFAEDVLNQYDEFWIVWQTFYPKIVKLCSEEHQLRYSKNTVYKYLFAIQWNESAKEWHSLKDRERGFFKKASEDMGGNSVVLYSIAKLLNDVGSNFISDGISWISTILQKTPELSSKELEVNTVYYLENLVQSYILKNRHKVKTDLQLKNQLLVILDFLLEKASVIAYLLREDIL